MKTNSGRAASNRVQQALLREKRKADGGKRVAIWIDDVESKTLSGMFGTENLGTVVKRIVSDFVLSHNTESSGDVTLEQAQAPVLSHNTESNSDVTLEQAQAPVLSHNTESNSDVTLEQAQAPVLSHNTESNSDVTLEQAQAPVLSHNTESNSDVTLEQAQAPVLSHNTESNSDVTLEQAQAPVLSHNTESNSDVTLEQAQAPVLSHNTESNSEGADFIDAIAGAIEIEKKRIDLINSPNDNTVVGAAKKKIDHAAVIDAINAARSLIPCNKKVNNSAIARQCGCSEGAIRKIIADHNVETTGLLTTPLTLSEQ